MRRALAIVLLGVIASLVQPRACTGKDLRFEAMRTLIDGKASLTGDPGPSILAARTLRDRPHEAIYGGEYAIGTAFIYPPLAARPYQPLADRSLDEARVRLSVVSRALFVAIVALLAWMLGKRAYLALAALLFFPLVHAVQLNQLTLAVTLLIGGALVAMTRARFAIAGVLLACACAFKPHLALLIPLLWWHARRTVVAAGITGAVLALLSVAYAGVQNHVVYLTTVLPKLSRGYAYFANQSANGLFLRLFADEDIAFFRRPHPSALVSVLTALVAILAYGATFAFVRKVPRVPEAAPWVFALGWIVTTAISPIAWQHHYAPALFVFALLIVSRRAEAFATAMAIAFVLLGLWFEVRFLNGAVSTLAVSHVFFGAIVLGWVLVRAIDAQRFLWTKNLPMRVSST
ncbi:MAG: glycosyltransferase family 87 protein [Polyangiales bacterium]